jgi:short chain dehydrogenase
MDDLHQNETAFPQLKNLSMNEKNIISRRKAIGGLGATLAAIAVSRGLAAPDDAAPSNDATRTFIENPVTKYPKPPFEGQSQPWPGLASKMNPVPDHGEKSYKGSGRLTGRKALITGGDSGMGRAAAIAYAREGADVAINYFPTEEPDAQEVIALIRAAGRNAGEQHEVHGVEDLEPDLVERMFRTNIFGFFYLTKATLPHLKAGAAIINTTSVQAYDPSPHLMAYACTKAAILNFYSIYGVH